MATSFILRSAICLAGLASGGVSHAGNLDRCDLARIAARNAALDAYTHVFGELKKMAPRAGEADQSQMSYRDANGIERFVDMPALVQALNREEASDLADADRRVSDACNDSPDELDDAVQAAGALIRHNISAVLTKRLTNADSSRLLP
jgi:hypothetical protein